MTHRQMPREKLVYRIGDPKGTYPIFSGDGARRIAGRWHERSQAVIYTSEHYSTAMLERLVHFSGHLPRGQHFICIRIPQGVTYEVVTTESLPGWQRKDQSAARAFGSRWLSEKRSCVLIVPSVVARIESNVLINPAHADFVRIAAGLEQPIVWDARLFDAHT